MEGDELNARLDELKLALNTLRKQNQDLEKKKEELKQAEVFILGQIKEREIDKPRVSKLPAYGTQEELEEALANRGKDLGGGDEEEL